MDRDLVRRLAAGDAGEHLGSNGSRWRDGLAVDRLDTPSPHPAHARPPAASLCVASGKGGTGKSVVCAALAASLARRARTLLVDADLGVGNAHILQDVHPEFSCLEVVEGVRDLREVRAPCAPNLDLVAGGSGISRLASLTPVELSLLAAGLAALEGEYGYLLCDSAAGISPQTLAFAASSDVVLVISTPDVTALTDAYAFLKVLLQQRGDARPLLLVNRARNAAEAHHVAERYVSAAKKFLGREPRWIGWLPEDPNVTECVNLRRPVPTVRPHSPFARALEEVALRLVLELEGAPPLGLGRQLLLRGG